MRGRIERLVTALCSDLCAGRAPGTAGGRAARRLVIEALREAGLDPAEQAIPRIGGANVLATIGGDVSSYVLLAAHYDHLGVMGTDVFRGADDNAAAVAILVETARALAADRPAGRGVIVAAFDAEEPPHFLTASMGSEHFARHPTVPLGAIDAMLCMDLVGHALGPPGVPDDVARTVFALGAELCDGSAAVIDATEAPGVAVRRVDAEIIPPLSDYAAFWDRDVPWTLLTCARSRVYHTPEDTPEALDWEKIEATARWLTAWTRATCAREETFHFQRGRRDDVATLDSMLALTASLAAVSPDAEQGHALAKALRGSVDARGMLDASGRAQLEMLVGALESGLA